MGSVRSFIVPGALLSSFLLSLTVFLVTASFTGAGVSASSPINLPVEKPTVENEHAVQDHRAGKDPVGRKNRDDCQVSRSFPQQVFQWCELITRVARKYKLDADLLAALILQESGGDPLAYSRSGAVGLMQVMPRDGIAANFNCQNGPCFANRPSMAELQDARFNLRYGAGMLRGLIDKYGDLREALMHYGPFDVGYAYADKVLNICQAYSK